jgi:hypothetical protein
MEKFEKIITINESLLVDQNMRIYAKSACLLIDFMFNYNKENKLYLKYFSIRTRDSVNSLDSIDMVMEWMAEK